MGERTETIIYKVVVDTNGIPDELLPGPGRSLTAPGGGGGQQFVQIPNRNGTVPQSPDKTPDRQQVQVKVLQRELISAAGQFSKIINSSAHGMRQMIGGSLGANPNSFGKGAVNVAGSALGGAASGLGRMGGAAGLVGLGAAGAIYAATKVTTAIIDILDRMAQNFARYNGTIAASQAQLRVATVMANIQMANATEPVIVAFNNLRIAAVGVGAGFVSMAAKIFGPSLESFFSYSTELLKTVAKKFGVDIAGNPKGGFVGTLAPAPGKFIPIMTGAELMRSGTTVERNIPGSKKPSIQAREQAEKNKVLLNLRARAAANLAAANKGGLSPSQYEFVAAQQRALASMEKHFSHGKGGMPIGGIAPIVKAGEAAVSIPAMTRAEQLSRLRTELTVLRQKLNNPNLDSLDRRFIQENIDTIQDKLKHSNPSAAAAPVIPGLKEAELRMMDLQRDTVADQRRLANAGRDKVHRSYLENVVKLDLEAEKRQQKKIDDLRHDHTFRAMQKGKNAGGFQGAPFASLDISQTVNLKMEMKLAYEKQVSDAMNQIRAELIGGLNTSRNEARLAALLSNSDRLGTI